MPAWGEKMREIFRSGTVSQFILTGNVHDVVPYRSGEQVTFYPLRDFLAKIMFARFDMILLYDRGKGLRAVKGANDLRAHLKTASIAGGSSGALPAQSPGRILDLIDRLLIRVTESGSGKEIPASAAVIISYANYLVPSGDPMHMTGETGANLVRILDWAENPSFSGASIATVLISDTLSDLNESIVESPFTAKITIPLPGRSEIMQYLEYLCSREPELHQRLEMTMDELSERMLGLSRINIQNAILQAVKNNKVVSLEYIANSRKELIEKECFGKLEFIETTRTLNDIAGHSQVVEWLRQDAQLMRRRAKHALPMGYLITGRIGTGKSFLVECFAGECGVPCVIMKNYREKWVGASEKNLEKIFQVLKAFGQVVVFLDEADQIAGNRSASDGDSGLSGRLYGMLAKEMAKPDNRGNILWIFATSRPDLLEVDLKRPGRLDVHIPLLPATDPESQQALIRVVARRMGITLHSGVIDGIRFDFPVTGSEIEGLLVRAVREYELQTPGKRRRSLVNILKNLAASFRPTPHAGQVELMDLLAVRECTDPRFLPPRFQNIDPRDLDRRIRHLMSIESIPDIDK